jgi:hypothetical protein
VITAVESIARSEGQMNLKISSKGGHVLYDSSLMAGVGDTTHDVDEDIDHNTGVDNNDNNTGVDNNIGAIHDNIDNQSDTGCNDDDEASDADDNIDSQSDLDSHDGYIPEHDPEEDEPSVRRSERIRHAPVSYEPSFQGKTYETTEREVTYAQVTESGLYSAEEAIVLASIITEFNERFTESTTIQGSAFTTTYSLKKGLERFGDRGKEATLKEMRQLHDRRCFHPINKSTLNATEKKRTLESLIFLVEKRDGTVKARHCANGSTQRDYMHREQVSSPTVCTESVLLTAVIDAKEGRDVATCDIPNAFIQTDIQPHDEDGHRTIMKIRGALVDILCEMDPRYIDYVVSEGSQNALYVHVTKAIYGLLMSALLFYRKLRGDLVEQGFTINPYDPCVANKIVDGKQITVCWHVDDLKVSHEKSQVIDNFIAWIKETYGKIGEVKVTRGKVHQYLGMTLDYSTPGQVSIDMTQYVDEMVKGFPSEYLTGKVVVSPWNENLFKVQDDSTGLSPYRSAMFHTVTAQGLFLCKRARPDINPAIAYLTTRVTCSNDADWEKLVRMMKFLQQTSKDRLTLRADDSGILRWHVDAAFAVHPNLRSHTGATLTMGGGAITTISRKQSMNTRSSTEAEIVAADEVMGPMLWTRKFLEWQGHTVNKNILYQDNKSAITLETNGRQSAGRRSRHLDIRLFFVTDQVRKGNITIEYCPTDDMTGDYMTKPLHGKKFESFRNQIMNFPASAITSSDPTSVVQQECVESNKSQKRIGSSKSTLKMVSEDPDVAEQSPGEDWTLVKAKRKRNCIS